MTRERGPRPGRMWESELRSLGEVVVPEDDGDSPFGWAEGSGANRETRRAAKRRNRHSGPLRPAQTPEAPEVHRSP